MKTSTKKILLLEIIMIFFLTLNFFISNVFTSYVYVVFLGIILAISYFLLGFEKKDNIYRKTLFKNVLIVLLTYFLVTYLLGLKIGFVKTIYNGLSNTNITKNIIPFILIVILSELIRFIFIDKSNKNKYLVTLSCIVFILFNISFNYKLYNLNEANDLFQFVGIIIIGNIASNIYLTIQTMNTGYVNNIKYRLIMDGYVYLVPFVPNLGPYVKAVLSVLVPVLCALSIYIKRPHISKASKTKKRVVIPIVVIFIFILVVMSNSGFFKYQNMTIGSNSMKPYMAKGDVIILEKLDKKEINDLKKGDILIFRFNNKVIAHRIYKVYDDNTAIRFRTKGDANDSYDDSIISSKQVIGVLRYRIKYIGIPSVWVEETFR